MMVHLEIEVHDLAAAVEHAVPLAATVAGHQAQEDVRVCLDPASRPFCLFSGRLGLDASQGTATVARRLQWRLCSDASAAAGAW